MKPITIIRHIACEGPGYLETILEQQAIEYQLIAVDQQQAIPESIENMSGLIIMGGPMSVNDNDNWVTQEVRLIRQAIEHNLPVLGHCLGGQFIAKALQADIIKNPVKEIGWLPVQCDQALTEVPSWLNSFSTPQYVFHWHGETFQLPHGATRLLSSAACENQAFLHKDNVLAFQCHIEMTAAMVNEWSALYEDELSLSSATIQTRQDMLTGCDKYIKPLNQLADQVYQYWLEKLERS